MQLTRLQIRQFFESVTGEKIRDRQRVAVHCPMPGHEDRTASATVFLDGNGGFNCSGCGFKGNVFQLAARLKGCTVVEAERIVAEMTGADPTFGSTGERKLVACYDYRDAAGVLVFQKRKYKNDVGKNEYVIYHLDGRGDWRAGIGDTDERTVMRPLYNLPSVVASNMVWFTEGEKDADTLFELGPWFPDRPGLVHSFSTSYSGAWQPGQTPKWEEAWNPAFYQKTVLLFEDNDDAGRAYTEHIAHSIHKIASSVRIIKFPDLPVKGDVSDWLKEHSKEELAKKIVSTAAWIPKVQERAPARVFVSATDFMTDEQEEIEWLIPGVVQRGANGFFAGTPKASKSFVCVDMCVALATATPWLEFDVPVPVKVGLVSREDNPALTRWRMRRLLSGRLASGTVVHPQLLDNLWINSRQQTQAMFLDDEENVVDLIAAIRSRELEIVFLDVFNVLHGAEENDNTAMRKILNQCRRIQDESGAAIGIVHHLNKDMMGNITQRLRGASAIAGYAEWIIGVTLKDEVNRVREASFEMKVSAPPEPFEFKINEDKENLFVRVERLNDFAVAGATPKNGNSRRMPYAD